MAKFKDDVARALATKALKQTGGSVIDDNNPSGTSVYSSNKIEEITQAKADSSSITNLTNKVGDLTGLTETDLASAVKNNRSQLTEMTNIKGTTQYVIFNSDGTVQKVQHKDVSNNVVREDVFTYSNNLITEVRTLNSGSVLTFKYHLDTLQTEVI